MQYPWYIAAILPSAACLQCLHCSQARYDASQTGDNGTTSVSSFLPLPVKTRTIVPKLNFSKRLALVFWPRVCPVLL